MAIPPKPKGIGYPAYDYMKLKTIHYWTIGFFERKILEPLIKIGIIIYIIFIIACLGGII